jgi:hypothetical protein
MTGNTRTARNFTGRRRMQEADGVVPSQASQGTTHAIARNEISKTRQKDQRAW